MGKSKTLSKIRKIMNHPEAPVTLNISGVFFNVLFFVCFFYIRPALKMFSLGEDLAHMFSITSLAHIVSLVFPPSILPCLYL